MGKTTHSVMPAISVGKVCHPGLKREDNQDSIASGPTPYGDLFVVSDGVGGYYGGAEASSLVAEGLPRQLKAMGGSGSAEHALAEAVKRVNAEVFAAAQSGEASRRRMSATLVAALIVKPQSRPEALIVNVGDSRAYLVRDGQLSQLSTDHTAVQGMLDAGVLTPAQAKDHPHSGVLTRTIGQAPEVNPSFKRVSLKPADQVLLCSDGLHGYVSEASILVALTNLRLDAPACAKALLDLALAAGGQDNISIQVIRVSGTRAPRLSAGAAKRPIRTAAYAAAGILAATTAGVGVFYYMQSRPADGTTTATVTAPTPAVATTPAATSSSAASAATSAPPPPPSATTAAPPPPAAATPQEEPMHMAGIIPKAKEELRKFTELEHELGSLEVISSSAHNGSCKALVVDHSIALLSSPAVRGREPVKSSQIAQMGYTFMVADDRERAACGRFDLVLIPYEKRDQAEEGKQKIEQAAKKDAEKAKVRVEGMAHEMTGEENQAPHPITSLPPPPPR